MFTIQKWSMSTNENNRTDSQDVYGRVTSQIVAAIENGVGTWRMPWNSAGRDRFLPVNVSSLKPYRGINTVCLWAAAESNGYDHGLWGTYLQWQQHGAQVRRGEKATTVVLWKFANDVTDNQDGEEYTSSRLLFVKGYSVFNVAQADGYTVDVAPSTSTLDHIAHADEFFNRIGATVRHGGERAYYSIPSDYIQMPTFETFDDNIEYYSTLGHEHIHWTAKPERCDRQLAMCFGDNAYAAEELVAELGAAFVCAQLGLSTKPRLDHAQYIQYWLQVMKADKRAIFTASSKAQQAADYLIEQAEPRLESPALYLEATLEHNTLVAV